MMYRALHITVRVVKRQQSVNNCWQMGLLSCTVDNFLSWGAAVLLWTSVSPVALKSLTDILVNIRRPPLYEGVLTDPL